VKGNSNFMNTRAKVFYILTMIILLLPAVVMLICGSDAVSSENRELAAVPVLYNEEGINWNFFNDSDSYISDHIGFRSQLVAANTAIYTGIFNMSPEDDVVLGKNGWLYYSKGLDDYFNIPTVSDRAINSIAYSLKMFQDGVEANDSEFVLSFAPNKSSLYPENMPANYIESDNRGNLERIEEALKAYQVNYVSLKELFEAQEEVYYRPQDSHWNYEGALKAYNALMAASSLNYDSFADLEFADSYEWTGDLANMLYATEVPFDDQHIPMRSFGYKYTSKQKNVEANHIDTANNDGEGCALVYRDSFGNTLIPYFAENFAECHFSKIVPYKLSDVEEYNPDITVVELVERNIPNLAKSAPVMMATEVQLEEKGYMVTSAKELYTAEYEQASEGTHIYGTIEEELLGDSYQVYVFVDDGEGNITSYEAFPIYEQYLLDGEEDSLPKDNGYSLYVPQENASVMQIVVAVDGVYYIL